MRQPLTVVHRSGQLAYPKLAYPRLAIPKKGVGGWEKKRANSLLKQHDGSFEMRNENELFPSWLETNLGQTYA